jgi:cytochrome c peroxidase
MRSARFQQNYVVWIGLTFLLAVLFGLLLNFKSLFLESNNTLQPLEVVSLTNEPIQPIPLKIDLDLKRIELGKKLFHETKLSKNNTISCASCHDLNNGGTDRLVRSVGIDGAIGDINAPTIFNVSFNFKQFWDGRAESLESQIDGPITNVKEMGSNWSEIVAKLKASPEYIAAFQKIYPDGINANNIKNAIAIFEQSLFTPNAPFDRFLRGDNNALTSQQKEGYTLFKNYGCVSCHQGINVGGNLYEHFGLMGNYFEDRGNITQSDLGRFNITQKEEDRYVFKVPSLRNIIKTPPYFHDGYAPTLDKAVKIMAKYQLGRELSQNDVDAIIQFLNSLTGEYQPFE